MNNVKFVLGILIVVLAVSSTLFQKSETKAPTRTIASVRKISSPKPAPSKPASLGEARENKDQDSVEAIQKFIVVGDESGKTETNEAILKEIRSKLKPETLVWSEKFPKPENILEEKFLTYLQLAYNEGKGADLSFLIPRRYPGWRNSPIQIEVYIEKCMLKLDSYQEFDLKNFGFWVWLNQRPSLGIGPLVTKQLEVYLEDPAARTYDEFRDLRDLISYSQMFQHQTRDIIEQMDRTRPRKY